MTVPGLPPEPKSPQVPSKNALLTQRSASFSVLLFTCGGALVYPALPEAFRSAIPSSTFTLLCGTGGLILHRAVEWLWNAILADLAKEGAATLRSFVRLRKVDSYVRRGLLSPERAAELLSTIAEQDILGEDAPRRSPPKRRRP
jgi:hypothetical protein